MKMKTTNMRTPFSQSKIRMLLLRKQKRHFPTSQPSVWQQLSSPWLATQTKSLQSSSRFLTRRANTAKVIDISWRVSLSPGNLIYKKMLLTSGGKGTSLTANGLRRKTLHSSKATEWWNCQPWDTNMHSTQVNWQPSSSDSPMVYTHHFSRAQNNCRLTWRLSRSIPQNELRLSVWSFGTDSK